MTRHIILSGLALAALTNSASAKPLDAFPPDPAGVAIADRLYEQLEVGETTYDIYAVMYETKDAKTKVDIYRGVGETEGMEWSKLYSWDVPRGPDIIGVLGAGVFEGYIQFHVSSWFKYVEARAVPVLEYNPVNGKFDATLQV